jgi:glycine oxidase
VSRILIVGGGVIGMLLAREMVRERWQVSLFDKGQCGQEASWAGGGIVSPLYPWRYGQAVTDLAVWSEDFYPQLVQELKQESGIDAELSAHGMLMLGVEDQDAALQWSQLNRRWMEPVDEAFLYEHEPQLAPGFKHGLFMPKVSSVRNPRLVKALRQSLLDSGRVELYENAAVDKLKLEQGRAVGVQTRLGDFFGDCVVVTAGAWSGGVLEHIGVKLPVMPVRGQMILFQAQPGLLKGMVLNNRRYLIPRQDGRILCGSTLEHVGFDTATTSAARDSLYQSAIAMLPALASAPIERQWAGLRPGSPSGVPFIGAVPGIEGLYVNAGQFRNGLVLAPGSVKVLADQLLGRAPVVDPRPYSPLLHA